MVTPAPTTKLSPPLRISRKAGSVDRTIVSNDWSPFVDGAHYERSAAEKACAAARCHRPRNFLDLGECFDTYGHQIASGRRQSHELSHGAEAAFVDIFADHARELRFASCRRVEAGFPVPEGHVAVGHRRKADMGDVVEQRHRRVEQAVAECHVDVGQGEQLLAQLRSVGEVEPPYAADLVRRKSSLDMAVGHRRVPPVVAVEVAQHRPHRLDRRLDDGALHDFHHAAYRAKCRLRASKPAWKTLVPMPVTSSSALPSSHSNSAVHSANVRLPSVTGVSLRVAT